MPRIEEPHGRDTGNEDIKLVFSMMTPGTITTSSLRENENIITLHKDIGRVGRKMVGESRFNFRKWKCLGETLGQISQAELVR